MNEKLNIIYLFRNFKIKKSELTDINFYEEFFEWEEEIPLETINRLLIFQGQEEKAKLYTLLERDMYPRRKSDTYYLPEGLKEIHFNSFKTKIDKIELIQKMKKLMQNKTIICPSTLIKISGDFFNYIPIKEIILNEGFEYFEARALENQTFDSLLLPSTIKHIDENALNIKVLKSIKIKNYSNFNPFANLVSIISPFIKFPKTNRIKKENHELYEECEVKLSLEKIVFLGNTELEPNFNITTSEFEHKVWMPSITNPNFRNLNQKVYIGIVNRLWDLIKIKENPNNNEFTELFSPMLEILEKKNINDAVTITYKNGKYYVCFKQKSLSELNQFILMKIAYVYNETLFYSDNEENPREDDSSDYYWSPEGTNTQLERKLRNRKYAVLELDMEDKFTILGTSIMIANMLQSQENLVDNKTWINLAIILDKDNPLRENPYASLLSIIDINKPKEENEISKWECKFMHFNMDKENLTKVVEEYIKNNDITYENCSIKTLKYLIVDNK